MPNHITTPGHKDSRSYVGGYFELQLAGAWVGLLNSVDGGHFKSETIGEQVGGDAVVTRFPGRQKFEDITFTCGSAMSPMFWKWVERSVDRDPSKRDGVIVAHDFDNRERARRTFYGAILSEVQFPALELKSRTPKHVTVKISPERITYDFDVKGRPTTMEVGPTQKQKKLTPQNFIFRMDGIDPMFTRRVHKIDAFTIKQNVISAPVGGLLYTPKTWGRLEFPSLSIYVQETYAEPWYAWWKDFVGAGNHVSGKEKTGAIVFTDSTFKSELLTLNLSGVGITGLTFDKLDAHTDNIRTVKIDLYVESMKLDVKG